MAGIQWKDLGRKYIINRGKKSIKADRSDRSVTVDEIPIKLDDLTVSD